MKNGKAVNGWKESQLGDLFDIARGGSPRPIRNYITTAPDGINWIKIGDAKLNGKYIYSTEEKIKPEGMRRSRFVKAGDFILSNSMSFGRPYILKTDGCIHDGWLLLRPRSPGIDENFLYYALSSDVVYEQFDQRAAGSIVRNLNVDSVCQVRIAVPPLTEQRRIVGVLDEAFAGIATAQANAEKNLQNARELFLRERETVFEQRTNDWIVRQLDEVCEISSSLVDPREARFLDQVHLGGANIESVTGDALEVRTAREENLISGKFAFDESMVLYSKIRPYLMKVARPEFDGLCSADIYPLAPKPELLDRHFLFHLLLSPQFTAFAVGGSARAGMPKVNRDHLFSFRFPVPPLNIQQKIAIKLDYLALETQRFEALCQRKIDVLAELKQSLLHRAFSGELGEGRQSIPAKPAPSAPLPVQTPGISATDLHAGILAIAFDMHERYGKSKYFTHVKAEKIAHMVEARLNIDLGRAPIRDAAGPNDFPRLHKVEHRARMANYFDFREGPGGTAYRVQKLKGFDRLIVKTRLALGDRLETVEAVLRWMLPMTVQQAEIAATVYAAWNNLLLDGKQPTEDEIVLNSRENWHPNKLKIERERFLSAVRWLKQQGVVPDGTGKRVVAKGK